MIWLYLFLAFLIGCATPIVALLVVVERWERTRTLGAAAKDEGALAA